jgi:NtrC-family two-component system sensor histidine kinase KinB
VRNNFEAYKSNKFDSAFQAREIRKDIFLLMDLNMQAIQRKSEVAKATADKQYFGLQLQERCAL